MRTTIDRGGRIVIPKDIRDEIGLHPGDEVEIELRGTTVEVVRPTGHARLVEHDGLLVVADTNAGSGMTDDDLRRLRLDVQR